ncbi:MAG: hypothetical protein AAFP98_06520 [Pseudomonadota bacterium]
MRHFTLGVLMLAANTATADDCPTFALQSDYLTGFFCGQLEQIIGPKTRTIEPSNPITSAEDLPDAWLALPTVRDAYRVDPARTLAMIQRIRDAGGEPIQ